MIILVLVARMTIKRTLGPLALKFIRRKLSKPDYTAIKRFWPQDKLVKQLFVYLLVQTVLRDNLFMFFKRGKRLEILNFEKCMNEERRYQKLVYTRAASIIVTRTLKGLNHANHYINLTNLWFRETKFSRLVQWYGA